MPKLSQNEFISPANLNTALQSTNPPAIFDVRKKPAFDEDPRTLPTANWQIHDEAEKWTSGLSHNHLIVVYCVHGHEVSQNAARALRDMGFDACYLQGGFEGWQEAELPVEKAGKK